MSQYKTYAKLSIEDFNKAYRNKNNMCNKGKEFIVTGENGKEYKLKRKSLRYMVFNKNTNCVSCGLKGTHYLIQKDITKNKNQVSERCHANLYGVNELKENILMTKDHIIRKREGGKDNLENLQTMCCVCNCVIKN